MTLRYEPGNNIKVRILYTLIYVCEWCSVFNKFDYDLKYLFKSFEANPTFPKWLGSNPKHHTQICLFFFDL